MSIPPFACFLILIGCTTCSSPQLSTGWIKPTKWHFSEFTEVRAYTTNWKKNDEFCPLIVLDNGRLNSTRNPKSGVLLNGSQIEKLRDAVYGSRPAPKWAAACFTPHHAFLFYSANGDIVGEIDICFQCGNKYGKPDGYATTWDLPAIKAIFKELNLPIENPDWD